MNEILKIVQPTCLFRIVRPYVRCCHVIFDFSHFHVRVFIYFDEIRLQWISIETTQSLRNMFKNNGKTSIQRRVSKQTKKKLSSNKKMKIDKCGKEFGILYSGQRQSRKEMMYGKMFGIQDSCIMIDILFFACIVECEHVFGFLYECYSYLM